MSPGVIVALIVAGIVLMVIAAFVAQNIENTRQERHRAVLAMKERTRSTWDILTSLPSPYLPAELRLFLLNYLCNCYREILALEPTELSIKSQLSNVEEMIKQPYQSQLDSPQPILTDHMTGQNARTLVKQMVDIVIAIHQEGRLDKQQAQQYIAQGKAMHQIINIDLNLITAREVEQSDNPKLALAHYNNCLKKLEAFNAKGQLEQRVSTLRSKVESLRQQAQEQGPGDALSSDQEQERDQEWDKFSDDSSWKIKQEYE